MTAKEIVHQLQDDGIMTEDKAVMLIKSYALKISQEAVGKVNDVIAEEEHTPEYVNGAGRALLNILSRIEKLTEES